MQEVQPRDLVQIKPKGPRDGFANWYAVVEQVRAWGVIVSVIGPRAEKDAPKKETLNLGFDDFTIVGKEWSPR